RRHRNQSTGGPGSSQGPPGVFTFVRASAIMRAMMSRTLCCALSGALLSAAALFAQPAVDQDPAADLLRQAQQKMRDGNAADALAMYSRALEMSPRSFQANNGSGVVLDLLGRYADARRAFARAIEVAGSPQQKAQAQRSMAIPYGIEGDC